jgi:hypothetical protein
MSRRLLALAVATALAAPAAVRGGPPTPTPDPLAMVVRVGVMKGSRGDTPLPVATRPSYEGTAFEGWDPSADNEELKALLGLRQIVEHGRAMVAAASDNATFSVAIVADGRRYEMLATLTGVRDEVVLLEITLKEDDREVSRPALGLKLGQRGVACARVQRGPDEAFVFFVLQVDRR